MTSPAMTSLAMYVFGLLTILSACGVVCSKKSLHSALWLVVTFFLLGVHFALLQAHFLATLQVLVYAGAIMVLVVFVILLLGLNEKGGELGPIRFPSYVTAILIGAFIGMTVVSIFPSFLASADKTTSLLALPAPSNTPLTGSSQELGKALFGKFFLPFEAVSVLLLAGVIGAVVLAYEPRRPLAKGRGLSSKQKEYGLSGE